MPDRRAIQGSRVVGFRGRRWGEPGTRRTARRAWTVEVLEGRALLSVYLVDRPGDTGAGAGTAGDLRYAIDQADQDPGNSTIVFATRMVGQTIGLAGGPLAISKPSGILTILAPGGGGVTVSGGGHGQVLSVSPISHVSAVGLTITGGVGPRGGGIDNDGQLALLACTIAGNTAFGGGGGGIYNGPYGRMTISQSTIRGNHSLLADGGGIANDGSLSISTSTISGDTAQVGSGGGLANRGSMTLDESTVSGNSTTLFGGGIANTSALTLTDDTISANTATLSGGGLVNQAFQGGTVSMDNTIVAGDRATNDPRTADIFDNGDSGGGLTGSHDLIGAGDLGALTATLVGVDPRLGPLQDNGGPTWTQALLPGSAAIGAGDPSLLATRNIADQRGLPYGRVVGDRLDIGAFETRAGLRQPLRTPIIMAPRPTGTFEALIGLTVDPTGPPPAGVAPGAITARAAGRM